MPGFGTSRIAKQEQAGKLPKIVRLIMRTLFVVLFFLLALAPPALAALTASGPGRVRLYEEEKGAPRGRQFNGIVQWSNEAVKQADGRLAFVARAEITIPGRQMKVSLLFQNDNGMGLIGQTIQVSFEVPPGFAGGKGILEIDRLRMKPAEHSVGMPFAGAAQKVRDGVFLLGIARSDLESDARLGRRKDFEWVDIPIVYGDKQKAILAVEKGRDGQQALAAMELGEYPLKAAEIERPTPAPPAKGDSGAVPVPPRRTKERTLDTATISALLDKRDATRQVRDPVQTRLEFTQSLDRVKESLSKCWRPDKDFKGSLRYRLTLEKDGKVTKILPFADNKNDNGVERVATAAILSCKPYLIPPSYRDWNALEVVFTQHVDVLSLADIPSEQQTKTAVAIYNAVNDPTNLTSAETRKLRDRVGACLKPTDFDDKKEIEIDLHLNADGSVAQDTRVADGSNPETGKHALLAVFKCQPYLLPAEKYKNWKRLILVLVPSPPKRN